ncbi:MAG TPA: hypothetical protein GXX59_03110 [Syntrophomonadaceae bacterium]|nr:hypothetical protein [Syntrophomonadaceae bacterium]
MKVRCGNSSKTGKLCIFRLQDERGAVLVFVVAALVVLLGLVALVTDVGILYYCRSRLSNAADAAALAGVRELPGDVEKARTKAKEYVGKNGFSDVDLDGDPVVSPDNKSITVNLKHNQELFFARILGRSSSYVGASATAKVGLLKGGKGVIPLGIDNDGYREGEEVLLKWDSKSEFDGQIYGVDDGLVKGWFGALDLDNIQGGGADEYRERLINGYEDVLEWGDPIITENGNMIGPTEEGIKARCAGHEKCTFDNHEEGCPRVVIVPVCEVVKIKNKVEDLKVIGFAAMFLESIPDNKNEEVHGRFVKTIHPGEMDDTGTDYGVYTTALVR